MLVEFGRTRVLCAASFTEGVPRWRKGSGEGWVTAEYAMLPRATNTRADRESVKGRIGGRTHEISRLIGRSLRAVIDTRGARREHRSSLDCDVLQADGGTRTAAITGAYVALADAVAWARAQQAGQARRAAAHRLGRRRSASASSTACRCSTSTTPRTCAAGTDMNVVVTGDGRFVEVQGTAEGAPFDRAELDALLDLAVAGCAQLDRDPARGARHAAPGGTAAVTAMPSVVLATHNAHKVVELRRILEAAGAARRRPRRAWTPSRRAPSVAETG